MTSKRNTNTFLRRVIRTRNKLGKNKLRLSIFKSNKALTAQIIDFSKQVTIFGLSTLSKSKPEEIKSYSADAAKWLGTQIGQKFQGQELIFDKGGFRYTGKIKIFVDSVRNEGVEI